MITDTGASEAIPVRHNSDVGLVRRLVARRCRELGFGDSEVGRAEIIVQEALRNVIKYAGSGLALVRLRGPSESPEVEVLVVDSGPGMDLSRAMEDGFSTGGSAGQGLGSIKRLADDFDAYSNPGQGVALLSRVAKKKVQRVPQPLAIGAVCTSLNNEGPSGDNFAVHLGEGGVTIMVVDGLGHGPNAFEASAVAIEDFDRLGSCGLEEILTAADTRMRHTRGGALSLARCPPDQEKWYTIGIGNVSMMFLGTESSRSALVRSGIVGAGIRRSTHLVYEWPPESLFIMFSDGLKSRISLASYPGLINHDPATIAAVLHRDFQRSRDDATVVVVKRR